jgi:peptide/nickel transport system permease protein
MTAYIIRRVLHGLVVIIIVTFLVFVAVRFLPGDPIYVLINPHEAQALTEQQMAEIRHRAGLDKPILEQYVVWMGGLLHGDLGKSVIYQTPVMDEIVRRLPISLHLGILAFIIGFIIGIPAGVICAIRRATRTDTVVTSLANLGITVPIFWAGIVLIYVFSLQLRWLPVMGYTSPFDDFWLSTRQIIMPVACLSIWGIAGNARQVRSYMLEVLRQDYIRTAWSKGLRERVVILRHALRNCLIPIVTFAGMGLSMLIGGQVLIESVFNIPGMGRLAVESVFKLDYAYVQGVVLIIAVAVVGANLLVDISYGWLDPRVRYD